MKRPRTWRFRPEFLVQNGRAETSARGSWAEAMCSTPQFKMAAAGRAQRGCARPALDLEREPRTCPASREPRPARTPPPPLPADKTLVRRPRPGPAWRARAPERGSRTSPFHDQRIKLSFASEPNSSHSIDLAEGPLLGIDSGQSVPV